MIWFINMILFKKKKFMSNRKSGKLIHLKIIIIRLRVLVSKISFLGNKILKKNKEK